jgi:hypothetical protein
MKQPDNHQLPFSATDKYEWVCRGIQTCLTLVLALLVAGMLLPPGPIDPETGRFRFISDGFESHPWVAQLCLVLVAGMVWLYLTFVWQQHADLMRCHALQVVPTGKSPSQSLPDTELGTVPWTLAQQSGEMQFTTGTLVLGVGSVVAFALVVFFPQGNGLHYVGCSLFILCYLGMHALLFLLLTRFSWHPPYALVVAEGGTGAVVSFFFALFAGFLLVALWTPRMSAFRGVFFTVSAAAEYAVFVALMVQSLLSLHLIRKTAVYSEELQRQCTSRPADLPSTLVRRVEFARYVAGGSSAVAR